MRVGADLAAVLANLRGLASENVRRGNPLRIEINFILSKDTAAEAHVARQPPVAAEVGREPCRSCRLNDVPAVRDPAERRRLAAAERRERLMARVIPAALLPARYRRRRVLRAEPIGFLDNPVGNSTIGGITIVQGWACGRSGRTIERIDILVDGVPQGRARYDQFRPDVGEANPGDGHSFSGFSYTLHTAALGNGPHVLGVTLTDSASRVRTLDRRPVVVRN